MSVTAAKPAAKPAEPTETERYPYWRRNMVLVPLINALCSLGFAVSFPFVPLVVRELGVTERLETWVGFMMLAFYIIGFVMNPVWGGIADHYGRRLMMLRASAGMGLFFCLIPFAPDPWWFAAAFLAVGVFNGFIPAGMALLVANTPPRRLGSALSWAQSGGLIGHTVGPAIGAALVTLFATYRYLFWFSGALLLGGAGLTLALVREVKRRGEGRFRLRLVRDLRVLLQVPGLGLVFFLSFVLMVNYHGNTMVLSIYMLELVAAHPLQLGLSEGMWVGMVAVGLSVASAVSLPVWGRVLDRFDPVRVLALGLLAAVLTMLPVVFVQTPLQLTIARAVFGLLTSVLNPGIVRVLKDRAPQGMDARAISYATAFQMIGMGVAPFVAGLVGPWLGLRAYFAFACGLTALAWLVWVRWGMRDPAPQ